MLYPYLYYQMSMRYLLQFALVWWKHQQRRKKTVRGYCFDKGSEAGDVFLTGILPDHDDLVACLYENYKPMKIGGCDSRKFLRVISFKQYMAYIKKFCEEVSCLLSIGEVISVEAAIGKEKDFDEESIMNLQCNGDLIFHICEDIGTHNKKHGIILLSRNLYYVLDNKRCNIGDIRYRFYEGFKFYICNIASAEWLAEIMEKHSGIYKYVKNTSFELLISVLQLFYSTINSMNTSREYRFCSSCGGMPASSEQHAFSLLAVRLSMIEKQPAPFFRGCLTDYGDRHYASM